MSAVRPSARRGDVSRKVRLVVMFGNRPWRRSPAEDARVPVRAPGRFGTAQRPRRRTGSCRRHLLTCGRSAIGVELPQSSRLLACRAPHPIEVARPARPNPTRADRIGFPFRFPQEALANVVSRASGCRPAEKVRSSLLVHGQSAAISAVPGSA